MLNHFIFCINIKFLLELSYVIHIITHKLKIIKLKMKPNRHNKIVFLLSIRQITIIKIINVNNIIISQ